MADVNITVDGKKISRPAGALLIEACKSMGIQVSFFFYYPGLFWQRASRMCLSKSPRCPSCRLVDLLRNEHCRYARGVLLNTVEER